jgi:hypothetical protein
MPPSGSGKDKILYTEAVGLVMIDYGDAVVGGFGKSTSGASLVYERMDREVYRSVYGAKGQIRGEERYKKANYQGTVSPNTVELDVGWQVPKRNLEIDYKRDIWPI